MNGLKLNKNLKEKNKILYNPIVEIVHFDKADKELLKESYPVSHFMDNACKMLRSFSKEKLN